jgi:hypothetical protein
MLNNTSKRHKSLTAAVAIALVAGCSRDANREYTAGGAVSSAATATASTVTPAAGPAVQVTRTDAKSVNKALEYTLTPENFGRFLAAADSLSAISGRDDATRAHLDTNITDAASPDADAGLKWLESNDSVSKAINSAGISVRDYYVASIATAAAAQFMDDPKAAPATPTLKNNAKFLQSHRADLAHLQSLRDHKPVVTSKP